MNADVLSRAQFLEKQTEADFADCKQDLHLSSQVADPHSAEDQLQSIPQEKIGKLSMVSIPWTVTLHKDTIFAHQDNDLILGSPH